MAEAKIGAGARVLRHELYPIKVDSVNKAAPLDENGDIQQQGESEDLWVNGCLPDQR